MTTHALAHDSQPHGLSATRKQQDYTEDRRRYWDEFSRESTGWQPLRTFYQKRLAEIYRFLIPPGMRVLELGCSRGDLLAAVKPAYGVGIDLSPAMIAAAKSLYPELHFIEGDAHSIDLGAQFDYIICSDLVNDVWDVETLLKNLARHCSPSTRVLLNTYSRVWELPRRLAEKLGLVKKTLTQNWLMTSDVENLLYLANFELIRVGREILWPVPTPLVGTFFNKFVVKLWPFDLLALTSVLVARPLPKQNRQDAKVSVVVAARNEAGNIPAIFDRVPYMGSGTELIFVEGNSSDNTFEAIQSEIARRPDVDARLFKQPGKGKGDAVRTGFQHATGELLMILDADMTVPPEDLPRFYEAWHSGKADFVNGVRLVYPMENRAMRFFNLLGNRFFSLVFTWLLNQNIQDTLCGTKVLSKHNYEFIAANRSYFGDFDPFGDFDLLFGAAKYNLKIVDLPIRYAERTYGDTNIQRWRHGVILLRMAFLAMRRIKFV
jgi:2-polyprenyl-3-methyl-5-hydroxy-6-metoxy-1,4-benzoquinol methylase